MELKFTNGKVSFTKAQWEIMDTLLCYMYENKIDWEYDLDAYEALMEVRLLLMGKAKLIDTWCVNKITKKERRLLKTYKEIKALQEGFPQTKLSVVRKIDKLRKEAGSLEDELATIYGDGL